MRWLSSGIRVIGIEAVVPRSNMDDGVRVRPVSYSVHEADFDARASRRID